MLSFATEADFVSWFSVQSDLSFFEPQISLSHRDLLIELAVVSKKLGRTL